MMAPEGGFYTAQDSQVNGVEAAAYVWTRDDIVTTLGEESAKLKVDDGYHINGNRASFDYLIPTSLAFDHLQPSRVEYPKPTRFNSAFAPDGLDVYEGAVSLVATFPKDSLNGQQDSRGAATAQACNIQICLPPSKLSISIGEVGK